MIASPFSKINSANLIGITGIARTGKVLVGGLISSLKKIEKLNVNLMWEMANQLNYTKKLSDESSVFLLRRGFSVISYNLSLGREVNTRADEYSSILSYKKPSIYFKRIKHSIDGDRVFKNIRKKKFNVPILIHYALIHSKLIFKAFPKIKIIQMEKNPVELTYSWMNKKYGAEFYKNERVGILTFKKNKKIFPWFAYGWEKLYFSLSESDKIVYLLEKLSKYQDDQYKKLSKSNKNKVLKIYFEDFVSNPKIYIKKIEKFLKTRKTNFSLKFLKAEKCPRKLKIKDYELKKSILKMKLTKKAYSKLLSMEKKYLKKIKFENLYY